MLKEVASVRPAAPRHPRRAHSETGGRHGEKTSLIHNRAPATWSIARLSSIIVHTSAAEMTDRRRQRDSDQIQLHREHPPWTLGSPLSHAVTATPSGGAGPSACASARAALMISFTAPNVGLRHLFAHRFSFLDHPHLGRTRLCQMRLRHRTGLKVPCAQYGGKICMD